MLLKNLIKNCPNNIKKIDITGLSLDSRKVKKGYLFFALKGKQYNGNKFIHKAICNGAKIVFCSDKIRNQNGSIPIVKIINIRSVLSEICSKFFKKKPKNVIAVTGTNGKTSVADFFYQLLSANKIPVASIGTFGVKKKNKLKSFGLTSPDIITLHAKLNELKKEGVDNVIIEASSHGLDQGRLEGINFKAGVFTNFSQDHLDYHKNMKNYFNAKMILFSQLLKRNKHIIIDKNLNEFKKIKKIAIKKKLKISTEFKSIKNFENYISLVKPLGLFQIKNLKLSILAAKLCGLKNKDIIKNIKKIKEVNGRLELVKHFKKNVKVFVDYAHTPAALQTVLRTLKNKYKKNISLVFGCGGQRDKQKRPLMAAIAKKYCKKIYITDDNPRNENPKKIRKQIIKNLKGSNFLEIPNRSKAIQLAIQRSEPYEIILVAGKGHENYQDYGKKIIKNSDKNIIKKLKINNNFKKINQINNSQIINKILKNKNNYEFEGVSINSKKIKKRNLFIAIKGIKNDGHKYIEEAKKNGAKFCVVSKNIDGKKIIKVKNTFNFLNDLAIEKRKQSNSTIIAITGSAGKTTVKTFLGYILNNFAKTCYSPKSYNNHFGVPLSLNNLEKNHKFGVFEVGMSRAGEINKLSKIIKPDIAIITNIAEAHIGNFKSIKEIAKAKGEIINNIQKQGILILNEDDKFFNYFISLAKRKKVSVITFGTTSKSDIHLISARKQKNYDLIKIKAINETILLKTNSLNIYNTLSIIAALKSLDLELKNIPKFFRSFKPIEGRGMIHRVKRYRENFKLIDESYNANPLSVKESIINFSKLKKNKAKKYLLLADMLELGNKSDLYHKKLAKIINRTDIDKFFVYGDKILNAYKFTKKSKQGNILQSMDDFDEIFSKLIKKNDYLMIKGSNSTGVNEISKKIIKGPINAL